ncbi:MAG TPA: hypothetical protein VFB62_00840 [Polyangiaceae bacterium]|jgi:hypothetical protein|nr:hypothetical protein [Polyangiaceae bacterium]
MTLPDFTARQLLLGAVLMVLSAAVSVFVVGIFAVWIPEDYFVSAERQSLVHVRTRAGRIAVRIGKNLLGILLVCVGVIMALPGVPGQGFLTILIGILFLDVPGKHKLVRRIVRQRSIHRALNRLRARYGKEPLRLPPDDEGDVSEP